MCPCLICAFFQFDALSWKRGVSCNIPIFTNISFSFLSKFHETSYSYIVHLKVHHLQLFFIYAKLCYWKKVLNVIYYRFCFLHPQTEHFPFSLRLFKIYIAQQKHHTIISFFLIYTKLCYRKRGLYSKLTHKLYKC